MTMRIQGRRGLAATGVAALLFAGCSGTTPTAAPSSAAASVAPSSAAPTASEAPSTEGASASASSASGTPVTANESEFKIALASTTVPAGPVTFTVRNTGTTEHEFVVFDTDLAADKLPLNAEKTEVDEEGEGIEAVDELENIQPGTSQTLNVNLAAGHYVAICNLPAHYPSGMRAEFTVE